MQVSREEILRQLLSVQPGTTLRDVTEQSSCVAFRDGMAFSYSDEVACFAPCSLQIIGAIPAAPFIEALQKFPEDVVDVIDGATELTIKGKGRGMRLRKEVDIVMPIDNLEKAGDWKPLNEDFADAVRAVGDCAAGPKSEEFIMTCVHITPDFVEACDNFQCARWKLATGASQPFLVKWESIKNIIALGMTEFSETQSWVHFRNPAGLQLACRRTMDEYKNTTPLFEMPGASPLVLPKGLADEVETAMIFARQGAEGEYVRVELRSDGKMRVMGIGNVGRFWAIKAIQYSGPPLKFLIKPKLLCEITKKFNECKVTTKRLKAKGGGFVYCTVLGELTEAEANEE